MSLLKNLLEDRDDSEDDIDSGLDQYEEHQHDAPDLDDHELEDELDEEGAPDLDDYEESDEHRDEEPSDDQEDDISDDVEEVVDQATENPDRAGNVREVECAHLVYRREEYDGTFEELWFYPIKDMQNTIELRRRVLSGTDIQPGETSSPDGKETYTSWSVGNVEMLNIKGLPN